MKFAGNIELGKDVKIKDDEGKEMASKEGIFIPSLEAPPSNPTENQMFWHSIDKKLCLYNGSSWVILNDWIPPKLSIGAAQNQGTQPYSASGTGHLRTFGAGQDDALRWNIELPYGAVPYDGSDIVFSNIWQLYNAPSAGNNVKWELDYAFLQDGVDNYGYIDGTIVMDLSVESRTARQQYTDSFAAMSGAAGSTHLQLTLRRNGSGAGSDNYGGDADLYGVNLSKG